LLDDLQQRLYISEQLNLELRHENKTLQQQLDNSITQKELELEKTNLRVNKTNF